MIKPVFQKIKTTAPEQPCTDERMCVLYEQAISALAGRRDADSLARVDTLTAELTQLRESMSNGILIIEPVRNKAVIMPGIMPSLSSTEFYTKKAARF